MIESDEFELSDAEAEQCARQIRIWGLESQKRLRKSKVLIIGISNLGAIIAKNVILAGVKSVCLLDSEQLKEINMYSHFLAPSDKIGENRADASLKRAKALNPIVAITTETKSVDELPDSYFTEFDIVCATDLRQEQLERINNVCRDSNKKFLCGDMWGMFGYMFADLVDHKYSEEVVQKKPVKSEPDDTEKNAKETVNTTVKQQPICLPFEDIMSADWSQPEMQARLRRGDPSYFVIKVLLRFRDEYDRNPDPAKREADKNILLKMRNQLVNELALPPGFLTDALLSDVFGSVARPTAVVGGVIGKELIKAACRREPPHNNLYFFNPLKGIGCVELIDQ